MPVEKVISQLKRKKSDTCCNGKNGLINLLVDLGFESNPKSRGNHHVFQHYYLSEQSKMQNNEYHLFTGHSIDCGHGDRNTIKSPYITLTIKMLETYKPLLEQYLIEK